MFQDCESIEEYSIEETTTEGNVTLRFILDCSSDAGSTTFDDQVTAITETLIAMDTNDVPYTVDYWQVCDNDSWPYTIDDMNGTATNDTSERYPATSSSIDLALMLETCESEYLNDNNDNLFLCIIMATERPDDLWEPIDFAAKLDSLSNFYLTFITFVGFDDTYSSLYAFLGSLSLVFIACCKEKVF